MKKKFYITTPIYYVNDVPHIGHAYTTIAADVLARFHRLQGEKVFLLTGTDEHGLKIQHTAEEKGVEPQKFADEISGEFKKLWDKLDIKYDNFIRTTNPAHKAAVQKVLQTLFDKGAIYKGEYEGLYCVACEQFRHENELVDGRCPDHDIVVEKIQEECYLLKMSDLQEKLIAEIESDKFSIRPERYKKEILSFLKNEKLKDISVSRKNVSWGVPLPFDPEHTTYVWVDAFLNYLTGLGWDGDAIFFQSPTFPLRERSSRNSSESDFSNLSFWPADIQLIGKDILRVHATIWPAILLHLGIPLPKMLFVHGHIRSGGRKMSKTLGNVIGIEEMLEKFGADGTRYLLMSAGTFGEDVDMTMERMIEKYDADLANGLGNLVSRVVKLAEKIDVKDYPKFFPEMVSIEDTRTVADFLNNEIPGIIGRVKGNNRIIEDRKIWELAKTNYEDFLSAMSGLLFSIYSISDMLIPFMPETSEKIKKALKEKRAGVLFPRLGK